MLEVYNCDGCPNRYQDERRLTTVKIMNWERDPYDGQKAGKWEPVFVKYCPDCLSLIQRKMVGFRRHEG